MVSNDLKGLGSTEGPALTYLWSPPSLFPAFVPWLAVLALLLLRSNRSGQAWWIGCPLAVAVAATLALTPLVVEGGPTEAVSTLQTVFSSLAFGAAAVWLLSPYLQHRLRFVVVLKMLLACGVMSGFVYLVRQDWSRGAEVIGFLVFLEMCVLMTMVPLGLAGWLCRRRYRPLALALWSAVFVAALPLAIATPLLGMSGGAAPWREFLTAVLGLAAACYAVLLLFLLLGYLNGSYRQRLKDLLRLETAATPPILAAADPLAAPEPLERSSI